MFTIPNRSDRTFTDFKLCSPLLQVLQQIGFEKPTDIQAQAIPLVLAGRDILGSSQTGTGKTGAFAIPLVEKLLTKPHEQVLVLTPTRELAMQVITLFHQLLRVDRSIKTALLIGGDSISKQLQALKQRPRLIIGTPGRVNDHLLKGTLDLRQVKTWVLDEMDRMLDIGFAAQIATIGDHLPATRQTLLFSATMPKHMEKLANQYLMNSVRIEVGSTYSPIADIEQSISWINEQEKFGHLTQQLAQRKGAVLIFVKTKRGADRLTVKLNGANLLSQALHSGLSQSKRDRVTKRFREEQDGVLVATDLASRGLDIPHIRLVINYDLPQRIEDYVHRIGRTARAGATGSALSFVTPEDQAQWRAIHQFIHRGELGAQQPAHQAKSSGRGSGNQQRARRSPRGRGRARN